MTDTQESFLDQNELFNADRNLFSIGDNKLYLEDGQSLTPEKDESQFWTAVKALSLKGRLGRTMPAGGIDNYLYTPFVQFHFLESIDDLVKFCKLHHVSIVSRIATAGPRLKVGLQMKLESTGLNGLRTHPPIYTEYSSGDWTAVVPAIRETEFQEFNQKIATEKTGDCRNILLASMEMTFVYLDVSDYSTYEPLEQLAIVSHLQQFEPKNEDRKWYQDRLSIGDGFIYCFDDAVNAVKFASAFANLLDDKLAMEHGVEFHYRIGIHVDEVYRFWDECKGGWNYAGEGINGGNRILGAIGKDRDDLVFLSDHVLRKLRLTGGNLSKHVLNRGRHKDKHKKMWRVYELQHAKVS